MAALAARDHPRLVGSDDEAYTLYREFTTTMTLTCRPYHTLCTFEVSDVLGTMAPGPVEGWHKVGWGSHVCIPGSMYHNN